MGVGGGSLDSKTLASESGGKTEDLLGGGKSLRKKLGGGGTRGAVPRESAIESHTCITLLYSLS